MSLLWLSWDPLEWLLDLDTLLLSLDVELGVLSNPLLEVILALGVADVLCPDIDPLWSDVVVDSPVDQKTNSPWADVPDDTSAAVVKSVWHTLVNGTIDMNVNDVTNAVGTELKGWSWHSVLLVLPSEEIASAPAETGSMTHLKRLDHNRHNRHRIGADVCEAHMLTNKYRQSLWNWYIFHFESYATRSNI